MGVATQAQLITEVRQRADMENSQKVTDIEIVTYLNIEMLSLYDLLIGAFQDYYVSSATFSLPANAVAGTTNEYALPTDFYKVLGLDLTSTSTVWPLTIHSYSRAERNRPNGICYHIGGDKIASPGAGGGWNLRIMPVLLSAGSYTLTYVPNSPQFPVGSTPTAVLDANFDRWRQYLTCGAAVACQIKEESDYSANAALQAQKRNDLISIAQNRDAGECEQIPDVTSGGWPRGSAWPFNFPDR